MTIRLSRALYGPLPVPQSAAQSIFFEGTSSTPVASRIRFFDDYPSAILTPWTTDDIDTIVEVRDAFGQGPLSLRVITNNQGGARISPVIGIPATITIAFSGDATMNLDAFSGGQPVWIPVGQGGNIDGPSGLARRRRFPDMDPFWQEVASGTNEYLTPLTGTYRVALAVIHEHDENNRDSGWRLEKSELVTPPSTYGPWEFAGNLGQEEVPDDDYPQTRSFFGELDLNALTRIRLAHAALENNSFESRIFEINAVLNLVAIATS